MVLNVQASSFSQYFLSLTTDSKFSTIYHREALMWHPNREKMQQKLLSSALLMDFYHISDSLSWQYPLINYLSCHRCLEECSRDPALVCSPATWLPEIIQKSHKVIPQDTRPIITWAQALDYVPETINKNKTENTFSTTLLRLNIYLNSDRKRIGQC